MRTLGTIAAAAVLAAGLATASHAQTQNPNELFPTTGTREIFFDGSIHFDPDNTNVRIGYGPFLNQNLQVGGIVSVDKVQDLSGGWGLQGFANWHFVPANATTPLLPYVGVNLGYVDPVGPVSGDVAYGAQAGVKYFLNSHVAARAEFAWTHYKSNNDKGINLGLSVFLR